MNKKYLLVNSKIYYEGESDGGNTPGGTPTPTPASSPQPQPQGPKTYTQAEVQAEWNRLSKTEREKWQRQNKELATQLQELQQNQNLTQQERDQLQQRIDELQTSYQTSEQKAQRQLEDLQKKYEKDTKNLRESSESWQRRFENRVKRIDIMSAASKYKAFNPDQIAAILDPLTQVREQLGEDQKPNGDFISEVDFTGIKDGKPVKLKLTVDEAVKTMTEMPQQYGNLFLTEASSGVNNLPEHPVGNGRLPDIDNMSLEDYKKNRPKIHEEMSKQ